MWRTMLLLLLLGACDDAGTCRQVEQRAQAFARVIANTPEANVRVVCECAAGGAQPCIAFVSAAVYNMRCTTAQCEIVNRLDCPSPEVR